MTIQLQHSSRQVSHIKQAPHPSDVSVKPFDVPQGSKYADRLPIGKDSVIKGAPAELVKAFYERWYRPESMAVVVVGDFEDPGGRAWIAVWMFTGGYLTGGSLG